MSGEAGVAEAMSVVTPQCKCRIGHFPFFSLRLLSSMEPPEPPPATTPNQLPPPQSFTPSKIPGKNEDSRIIYDAASEEELKRELKQGEVSKHLVSLILARDAKIKDYKTRKEIDAINEERKESKEALEPYAPVGPRHDQWWKGTVALYGWTNSTLYNLYSFVKPEDVYAECIVWWKEELAPEDENRPHWRYTVSPPGKVTLNEVAVQLRRHSAYVKEQALRTLSNEAGVMKIRLKDLERVVFFGSDRVALGEDPIDVLEKECEKDAEEAQEDIGSLFDSNPCGVCSGCEYSRKLLVQFIKRVEFRMQALEGDRDSNKNLRGACERMIDIYSACPKENLDEAKKKNAAAETSTRATAPSSEKEKEAKKREAKKKAGLAEHMKKKREINEKAEKKQKEKEEKEGGEEEETEPVEEKKDASAAKVEEEEEPQVSTCSPAPNGKNTKKNRHRKRK